MGPKRLLNGRSTWVKLTFMKKENGGDSSEVSVWLPRSDKQGIIWWGGRKHILPWLQLVSVRLHKEQKIIIDEIYEANPKASDKDLYDLINAKLIKTQQISVESIIYYLGNSSDRLKNFQEREIDKNQEDEDNSSCLTPLNDARSETTEEDDTSKDDPSKYDTQFLSSGELLNRFCELYPVGETSPFKLKGFLQKLYNLLISGSDSGTAWLTPVESESPIGEQIAQSTVITAKFSRGPILKVSSWGSELRSRDKLFCDLHTPGSNKAGLVKHLALKIDIRATLPTSEMVPTTEAPPAPETISASEIQPDLLHLGLAAHMIPYVKHSEPRRLLLACGGIAHAEPLARPQVPSVQSVVEGAFRQLLSPQEPETLLPGTNLMTAFTFFKGWNHEDGIVISQSAAKKLQLKRHEELCYPVPWAADPVNEKILRNLRGAKQRGEIPRVDVDWALVDFDEKSIRFLSAKKAWSGRFPVELDGRRYPWPADVEIKEVVCFDSPYNSNKPPPAHQPTTCRAHITLSLTERLRDAQPGDKIFNRHGNKGVIAKILPDHEMPKVKHPETNVWYPVEVLVNPIGVMNRGNFGQLAEAIRSWESQGFIFPADEAGEKIVLEEVDLGEQNPALVVLDDDGASLHDLGEEGTLLLRWHDKVEYRAICGLNFWMRSLHESASQSRLTPHPDCSIRALTPPRGSKMRSLGLRHGEMSAWALSVRRGATDWVSQDLLNTQTTMRGHKQPLTTESSRRFEAWRWLYATLFGYQSTQKEQKYTKHIKLKGKMEYRDLPYSVQKPDHPEKLSLAYEFLRLPKDKGEETGVIGRETHLWLTAQIGNQSMPKKTNTNPVGKLRILSDYFTGDKDFVLQTHLNQTPVEIVKSDKPRTEHLRRKPLVEWSLCLMTGISCRAVITPAPDLEIDQLRLPWWAALHLFWGVLPPDSKRDWQERFKKAPPELLADLIEGHSIASSGDCLIKLFNGRQLQSSLMEQLENDLGIPEDRCWVVSHRDPVLHFGSVWTMRVRLSPDASHTIGYPLQGLSPIGGDYDGDTVGVVPVLNYHHPSVQQFCQQNSPLIQGEGGDRLFELKDLAISKTTAEHLSEESTTLFPLEKDLELLKNIKAKDDREDLARIRIHDFERYDSKMRCCSSFLRARWMKADYFNFDVEDPNFDFFINRQENGGEEDNTEIKYLFKTDHIQLQENDRSPMVNWWQKEYLLKLPIFFYESQHGAGKMGGLYRRMIHKHIPEVSKYGSPDEWHEAQRDYVVALQQLMERLQQSVLKFKKNENPIKAAGLEGAWKSFFDAGQTGGVSDKKTEEFKEVKDLIDKKKATFKLLVELASEENFHAQVWIKGAELTDDTSISLYRSDPRYLFINEDGYSFKREPEWTPLKLTSVSKK